MDEDEQHLMYGNPDAKPPEGVMCGHCGSDLTPELKHAEVLRLQEGDVVVLRFKSPLHDSERVRIREAWSKLLPGTKTLVFDGANTVDLTVVRQAVLEQAATSHGGQGSLN